MDAVALYVESKLANAPFDKTKTGRVAVVEGKNLYTVEINGKLMTGVPTISTTPFTVNQIVKVLIPENQYSNMYIIGQLQSNL